MKLHSAALLLLCALVGVPSPAAAQLTNISGPKNTTTHGYYVIKFRIAFDPINRVYLQVWDDPAQGRARGQFLDTLGNRLGGAFDVTPQAGTGWVNVTFGGPSNKPRFLVTYLLGNGSTNPKYARLVEYTPGGPSYGVERHIVDVFGEWSDADIAQSVWTGSQFIVSWRWQGASFVRGVDIDGNYTAVPQSLGDGLDVEVNPNVACGAGVCLAHGFAFGTAFGAIGGSWARFFDPSTLAPIGPVFYLDNHVGIMEDQRVIYNEASGQFQLAWVRLKSAIDFRSVAPNGTVGPLDLSQSLAGGQISMTYNQGTQTALVTQIGSEVKVWATELDSITGYPKRIGGVIQQLPASLDWGSEGSPPLYYGNAAANSADAQWLVVFANIANGRVTALQGTLGQAGNYDVTPGSWTPGSAGGTQNLTITALNGSPGSWTATSSDPSWLTVSSSGGIGSANITLTASANPFPSARSASLSVAGRLVLVTQAGTTLGSVGGTLTNVTGPKNTTNHGYYVIKFRVAFDPINRVYLQVWDDPAHGRVRGQFLDTLGNPIGSPFNATQSASTGWVNVTFGGPSNKPRFLMTYLVGNGSNNPKYAQLVEYANGNPSFGAEQHVTDVFGEWSDADIAQSLWTGNQFIISWRWQGASFVRGMDIDGNFTVGPQSLGDGLDVEVNPNIACGSGVCLAHGFAFGTAFGAIGGSWARFFNPTTLAPIGPVFYSDNHVGIMEDQRVVYNTRTGQFQLAWVRLKRAVDFRLVSPNGQVGPLDPSLSLPAGQIALSYNQGTQTSLLTGNFGPEIRVTGFELGDSGYPLRDNNGALKPISISLDWPSEGSPPLYYSMPVANDADAQWLVVFSNIVNGRATVVQGLPSSTNSISASPTSWTAPPTGGSQPVTVTASSGVAWTAVSNQPSWLTVTGGSGTGNGVFTMHAAPNPSAATRTANVTVGSQTIQVTQPGKLTHPAGPPVMHLDGDSSGDVFTYKSSNGQWGRWLAQNGGGFAGAVGTVAAGYTPYAAEFNGDALTDVFLSNATTGVWVKMLNTGSGYSVQAHGAWLTVWQKHVIDLDGDGISDFFLYDPATGFWYKAISTPTGFNYFGGQWNPNWEITPLNLNGDAFGDMFLFNRTTGRWFWVLGQSGGGFTYPREGAWITGWQFFPGDFNGDGLSDLFLLDPTTGSNYTCLNTGTDFTYSSYIWTLGWTPYVADLDADGADDLFIFQAATGQWFKMISNKTGAFGSVATGVWASWQIHPVDMNGDRRADLLLYNPASGAWYQAFNLVNSGFTYANGFWDTGLAIVVGTPGK